MLHSTPPGCCYVLHAESDGIVNMVYDASHWWLREIAHVRLDTNAVSSKLVRSIRNKMMNENQIARGSRNRGPADSISPLRGTVAFRMIVTTVRYQDPWHHRGPRDALSQTTCGARGQRTSRKHSIQYCRYICGDTKA